MQMESKYENNFLDLRKYKVLERIGSGSFGKVYKVKNLETEDIYAAKISNQRIRKLKDDKQKILYLFREIKIMSSMNHPSIIQYIGYSPKNFEDSSKPTIITEYAPNGSLRDLIKLENNCRSLEQWDMTRKLICIYGIASGMSYMHQNNIIHRDLKPENILIDHFLHPKIADFGLSKLLNGITESLRIQSQGGFKGTYLYSAPEVLRSGDYSEASDVYSFAMIVYEIMNQENSFNELVRPQLFEKLLNGLRPQISEIVPDAYRELIEKCWSNDSEERPKFSEIVNELINNPDFITPLVNEDEFLKYVDFIENSQISFDLAKQSIHMNQLFRRKVQKFQRMTIQKNDDTIIGIFPEKSDGEINSNAIQKEKSDGEINSNTIQKEKSDGEINSNTIQKEKSDGEINSNNIQIEKSDGEINTNNINDESDKNIFVGFFPLAEYNKLNPKCQKFVKEAENDKYKQYLLAVNLLEEKNGYPGNTDVGLKYLQNSKDKKCTESMIYYCKLLIDGYYIDQDLDKAELLTKKIFFRKLDEYYLLLGQIEEERRNYSNAKKYYKKSIKLKNAEAMHCYGFLIFNENGVYKNAKDSFKYFNLAQKNGYYNQINDSNDDDDSDDDDYKYNENNFISKSIANSLKLNAKVVAVGDAGGYKTKLLFYLAIGHLNNEYIPTVFDNYVARIEYNDIKMSFLLWDTSGSEDLINLRVLNYGNSGIVLLVFSLIDKKTFQNIFDLWLPEVIKYTRHKPIFLLIGVEFEIWCKDPHNPNYVHQEDLDLAAKNENIYKVIKFSYYTGTNMELVSMNAFAEAFFDVNNLTITKRGILYNNSKKSIHKNKSIKDIKIQVCCVGNDQSGIENFLDNLKSKNDDVNDSKKHKIIEHVEDFDIFHIFKGKDVILQFSQASFQDAVQLIQSGKSKTQVFLLLFSLINRESFHFLVHEWSDNVVNYDKNDILFLVGVDSENWDDETPNFVTQKEINEFSQNIGAYKIIKCSYVTGNKIEYLKDQITKSIISRK